MEENPKSIARPRVYPPPTRYKKSTETSWDDQTSRCHDGNVAPVDDDRNEAACRRPSSRGFSRRPIRPPKPLGSVNKKTPRRSVKNDEPRWRVASAKSTRGNRSTAPSCDAIKRPGDAWGAITQHHGSTPTTTTTPTTPLPTRGHFTLSHSSPRGRRQGHCGRGGEWCRGVRGQERLGRRDAQETRGENLLEAGAGQPAPGAQHAQPMDEDGRGQVTL